MLFTQVGKHPDDELDDDEDVWHTRNCEAHTLLFGKQHERVPLVQTGTNGYKLHKTIPPLHCGLPDVHENIPELLEEELEDEDELVVTQELFEQTCPLVQSTLLQQFPFTHVFPHNTCPLGH